MYDTAIKENSEKTEDKVLGVDLRLLNKRDQEIMRLRYTGKTYREIGELFCISRQRVEQIISKASEMSFEDCYYPNLSKGLRVKKVSRDDLSEILNVTVSTITNKINGYTDWKLREAIIIKKVFFPKESIEYLFDRRGK